MDEYEEMIKEIREKEKIIKERLKEFDDRTSKTMTENEEMTLDEIVARLKKPGVFVKLRRLLKDEPFIIGKKALGKLEYHHRDYGDQIDRPGNGA